MQATTWMLFILLILVVGRFIAHARVNYARAKDYAFVGNCFLFAGIWIGVESMAVYPDTLETSDDYVSLIIGLFVLFGVPAIVFYVMSSFRKKKMQLRYQTYYHHVMVQGITDFHYLAGLMGLTVKHVTRDLNYMVGTNMIPNVFGGGEEYSDDGEYEEEYEDEESGVQHPGVPVAVTCSGCGATASVQPGVKAECEFCGNALHVQVS